METDVRIADLIESPTSKPVPGATPLRTMSEIRDFVDMVRSGTLTAPAIIVTKPGHASGPYVPLEELQAHLSGHADLYFLDGPVQMRDVLTGSEMYEYNVYGGAARVFPTDEREECRLFFAHTPAEGRETARKIVDHVRRLTKKATGAAYTTATVDPEVAPEKNPDAVLAAENATLRRRLEEATAKVTAARQKPRAVTPAMTQSATNRRLFLDAAEETRYRVNVLWVESTSPQEKEDNPLPEYEFGPDFAGSLDELSRQNPVVMDKTARAVLKLLLGQDREGHKNTNCKPREDGAVAWRTYIEQKTASARRLHYWRKPGGTIELSRVVLHDDYTP